MGLCRFATGVSSQRARWVLACVAFAKLWCWAAAIAGGRGVEGGLGNNSPQAKSNPLPDFINKNILKRRHTYSLMCHQWQLSCDSGGVE